MITQGKYWDNYGFNIFRSKHGFTIATFELMYIYYIWGYPSSFWSTNEFFLPTMYIILLA